MSSGSMDLPLIGATGPVGPTGPTGATGPAATGPTPAPNGTYMTPTSITIVDGIITAIS